MSKAIVPYGENLLLVGEYTGIGATKEEFVNFMASGGITVIFDELTG